MASKKRSKQTVSAAEAAARKELRAMSKAQLLQLQSKIGVEPDGKIGPGTAAALVRYRREQARKQRIAADKAKADARRAQALADANAAKAKAQAAIAAAEAKRITAQSAADAARARAEADQRAEAAKQADFRRRELIKARKAREATVGGLSTIAAAAAGVVVGKKLIAKGLDARFAASVNANRPIIEKLAKEANRLTTAITKKGANKPVLVAKMTAVSKTARLSLPAARSPLGLGIALAAGGLGGFSLYRGQVEDEFVSKLAFNTSAGLELGTAVGTIGQQLANRANPTVAVPVKELADIRAAGEVAKAQKSIKPSPRRGGKPTPKEGAKGVTRQAQSAAALAKVREGTNALAKLARAGSKALPLAVPVLIGVSLGTGVREARAAARQRDGLGVAKAASNTAADIANTVTFGATGLIEAGLRKTGRALHKIEGRLHFARVSRRATKAENRLGAEQFAARFVAGRRALSLARARPTAYLNRTAAKKAQALPAPPPRLALPAPASHQVGGGKVSYQTADGRTVQGTKGQVARWRKQRKN